MDSRKLRTWILVADLAWAAVALIAAFAMRYGVNGYAQSLWKPFSTFGVEFVAAALLWVVLHEWMRLDGFHGGWYLPAVFSRVFLGVLVLMTALLSGAYLASEFVSRLVLTYFGVLLFVGFVSIRWVTQVFFKSKLATQARRRVVIVGTGRIARELAAKIERHPEVLCRVVGCLTPFDAYAGSSESSGEVPGVPVQTLGIVDLLRAYQVDEMILVGSNCTHGEMLNLAARCRNEGIQVSLVPELYELYLSRPNLMDLDGLPVLQLPQPGPLATGGVKRVMDLALASLLVAPAVPILIVSALLLRSQKAKAFRWEMRGGHHGKPFRMLRLNVDRYAANLTVMERVLQQLSVTELPQLLNVLTGDMSLVGPRPESMDRVSKYSEWERQRLAVRPGITGLAQVYGMREQHSSEEKCRFDLQYLLDCSPFLDLSLLLQTVWTLVARSFRGNSPAVSSFATEPPESLPFLQEIVQSAHRTQSSAD
jgi:lipopolysaccharide/colanic/teichoic acid biosynthesis glycosyltransferase